MRTIALILLALLCSGASAAPPCIPALYGTQVGNTDYARTDAGWFAYWYCKRDDGTVIHRYIACVHGSCLPIGTFTDRVTGMKRGANPVQTLQAAWDAEFGNKCSGASGALKTVCDQASAAAVANMPQGEAPPPPPPPPSPPPPPPPPPIVYTHAIKPNGTSTTRPVYMLVAGVRSTTSIGRADVGQPCDLTAPTLASGSDVWAQFGPLFEPGKVALCAKK